MSSVRLPSRIYGEWIWKKSLLNTPDSFLLFRKEFSCAFAGLETYLWISANSSYQLFLNGRLIGFGPRAHHSCGVSYIDQHDIGFYLESGINVLAVKVYYNEDGGTEAGCRVPGMWCQMASSKHEVLCSDSSWSVCEGRGLVANRARIIHGHGMTQVFNAAEYPPKWVSQMFMPDHNWQHPDVCVPVGEPGTTLELHPLSPAAIEEDLSPLLPVQRGKISRFPAWTGVVFRRCKGLTHETFAGAGYIFREEACEVPVEIFCDDPFKLFCNNQLVASAPNRCGEPGDVLRLKAGWNRLLVIQSPGRNSMGLQLIFPGTTYGDENYQVLQDTVETAPSGWVVAGPLRLTLKEATSSLRIERLPLTTYASSLQELTDPYDLLYRAEFQPEAEGDMLRQLVGLDYVVYRLDKLRYGFISLEIEAGAGDIIDVVTGRGRTASGMVSSGANYRNIATIHCRAGKTVFISTLPTDCFYIGVAVRRTSSRVRIDAVRFCELVRIVRNECSFHCSDPLLNRFWEIGRQTLRRSAAFIPLSESRADYDCYMLDAYIDAANMAAVFGDTEYITARLRQFVGSQLENGDIPALSFGRHHMSQIHHLFFLPIWMNYNYRFTANRVELERTIPILDLTREYFEAMLDEETGLLADSEGRFSFSSPLSEGKFPEGESPTYLNALFCRFLLSAAEAYRTVEAHGAAAHCVKLANRVAGRLRTGHFSVDNGLFARWRLGAKRKPDCNLFANFCAMFSGVLPPESFETFFNAFFNLEPPYDRSRESASPYFHFLFMEMMFAFGQRDWAYGYFRNYWEHRICDEACAWKSSPGCDEPAPLKFSDGSCVSPNIFLIREVLGIRIAEAGHSVIYFNPACKLVDSAEALVPLANGRLRVSWKNLEDGGMEVTFDSNIPLRILPELSHAQLKETSFRLGENITLLNPPDDDDDETADGDGISGAESEEADDGAKAGVEAGKN